MLAVLPLLLALTACGGGDREEELFTATGVVSVIGGDGTQILTTEGKVTGGQCKAIGDFGDIHEGAEVLVLDANGAKIAFGELGEGALTEGGAALLDAGLGICEFPFSVEVPKSEGVLTLRVGLSEMSFTADKASDLELSVAGDQPR